MDNGLVFFVILCSDWISISVWHFHPFCDANFRVCHCAM